MPEPIQVPWRTILITLGVVFLAGGLLWPLLSRYLGRLPGDIVVRRGSFTLVFPIATCLLLSLLLTLLFSLFRR